MHRCSGISHATYPWILCAPQQQAKGASQAGQKGVRRCLTPGSRYQPRGRDVLKPARATPKHRCVQRHQAINSIHSSVAFCSSKVDMEGGKGGCKALGRRPPKQPSPAQKACLQLGVLATRRTARHGAAQRGSWPYRAAAPAAAACAASSLLCNLKNCALSCA
jgi:hypothetical protein